MITVQCTEGLSWVNIRIIILLLLLLSGLYGCLLVEPLLGFNRRVAFLCDNEVVVSVLQTIFYQMESELNYFDLMMHNLGQ